MHQGQMQKTDIDAACFARIKCGIQLLPSAAKGRAGKQLIPEDAVTKSLRLLHQGGHKVAIIDNAQSRTAALEVQALDEEDFRRAEMADETIVVDMYLQPATGETRRNGIEDIPDADRS